MQVFWDITPCQLVNTYASFEDVTVPRNVGFLPLDTV